MSNLALRVDNLGKMYRIGGKQERYSTLRDTITDAVAAPFRRARSLMRGEAYGAAGLKEEIWALKDVSFEVRHGEVVGIIGRNGAGKSTLLKILSRITEPTTGYTEVFGRVGALLEVGTGFHPELTGRENIYLNGAILGMSREEINRKFDEIVDFAEIERFIDTPVKHYSSGMGLRLGFAVAAHLEPEILVVDEVLAVGDAQFQKKCLGKMSDVAGEGRTVLFVSHNMAAVKSLCPLCILLGDGELQQFGTTNDVIHQYQATFHQPQSNNQVSSFVSFTNYKFNEKLSSSLDASKPFSLGVDFITQARLEGYLLYCILRDIDNNAVIHARIDSNDLTGSIDPGQYTIQIQFPALFIRPGIYTLEFKLLVRGLLDKRGRYLSEPTVVEILGNADPGALPGILTPNPKWHCAVSEPA